MTGTGVMICGHGSRDQDGIREFESIAEGIRKRLPQYDVESGFLEFATPIIRDGLDRLRQRGNRQVLAVPGMLFAAGHAKNDIPSVLNTYETRHPTMKIHYARELGLGDKMLRAAGDRIRAAMADCDPAIPMHQTMLVVVGRGASDPEANANVSKLTRMLWEGFGFGWAMTAYSGVTFPLVEPCLAHVTRLPYRRVLVFPYFLFTGVLVKRIYAYTELVARRHADIEFLKVPYLNDHPLVLDTFADRVQEMLHGENRMNCKLCKYRDHILGFEAEKGLAQQSHHHHAEGEGHSHGGDHHAHNDNHDHGHHPYPHADHPLGPKTLRPDIS